jgi:hypothetical protein
MVVAPGSPPRRSLVVAPEQVLALESSQRRWFEWFSSFELLLPPALARVVVRPVPRGIPRIRSQARRNC